MENRRSQRFLNKKELIQSVNESSDESETELENRKLKELGITEDSDSNFSDDYEKGLQNEIENNSSSSDSEDDVIHNSPDTQKPSSSFRERVKKRRSNQAVDIPEKIPRRLNSTDNNEEDFQNQTISLDPAIVHHGPVAMKNNQR